MTVDQQVTPGVGLTQAAADKAKDFIAAEDVAGLALRVAAVPAGCAGMRYQLGLDERSLEGDVRSQWFGVDVVADAASAPFLAGATIDWSDGPDEQGFTIDNPNLMDACSCDGCGCGCDGGC